MNIKTLFSITIVFILIISCQNRQENNKPLEYQVNSIKTPKVIIEILNSDTFYIEIVSNGKLEALQKTDLKFRTGDKITEIKVSNKDNIKKGTVIAILENARQKIAFKEANNLLDDAKVLLQQYIIEYGYELKDTNNIPNHIIELLKVKSGYNKALTQVSLAKKNLNDTYLEAPFTGIIANLDIKVHNYITANDIFCTLIDQRIFNVSFPILETDLKYIDINDKVMLKTFDNIEIIGYVDNINPLVSEDGMIKIKALVNNESKELIEGMNVNVIVQKSDLNALQVPKSAVVERSGKKVVFTYVLGRAKWNYVTIVDENSKYYKISDGLTIGDSIIVDGNMNLAHDSRVELQKIK